MREKLSLSENGCVWEGILKVPKDYPVENLKTAVKENDSKNIVKDVEVKLIEKLEK